MWPEDLRSLVFKLLAIYSVHISVILGGIFARPRGALERPPASLAWVAIVLATFWNLLFIWRSITFTLATEDSVTEVIKYMDGAAAASSFLVTGALTFFFTRGTETVKTTATKNR
jgi:hypothetical protein